MKSKIVVLMLIAFISQFVISQNAWAGRFEREDPNCSTRCTSAQKSAKTCHDYKRTDGDCYQVITSGVISSPGDGNSGSGRLNCGTCPLRCSSVERNNGCEDFRDSRTKQCCKFIP